MLEGEWQRMARAWLSTGVIADTADSAGLLQVTANGAAMQVTEATGVAWVEGFLYRNDTAKVLTIGTADAANPRIDTVVVRLDRAANTSTCVVKPGVAAANPAAPALTQTDALWDLPLADVRVDAAVGVIAAGKVTDRRVFVGPRRLGGLGAMVQGDPSTVVVRDTDGAVTARLFRSEVAPGGTSGAFVMVQNTTGGGGDNGVKPMTLADFKAAFGKAADADLLDGFDARVQATPNTVAVRDGTGGLTVFRLAVNAADGRMLFINDFNPAQAVPVNGTHTGLDVLVAGLGARRVCVGGLDSGAPGFRTLMIQN